jgi:hypothetical protein
MAVEGKREMVALSLLPLNPAVRETPEPEPGVTIPAWKSEAMAPVARDLSGYHFPVGS